MPVTNADIAAVFEEIADLLEIQGENPFRIRAYRNAARSVRDLPQDARSLITAGEDLTRLPGIGKDLAEKIHEIVTTGSCGLLERLHRQLPAGIRELMAIPGLGPKRVRLLYREMGIDTREKLQRAARDGSLRELPGFGDKTAAKILATMETTTSKEKRFRLAEAAQHAEPLAAHLAATKGVERVVIAGSYRRGKETVGDIDILVITSAPAAVMERFVTYEDVAEVLSHGSTRSSVVLRCGLQVDVRVMPRECFGAALHYFTGSRAHNIAIRRLGQERGLKINEYGIFKGERRIGGAEEEDVFSAVGLRYIPPELREDRGEIEAARAGLLPELVTLSDIKGDLHVHTKASDGHNSIEEMALAARERGLSYIAISEHSCRLTVARGLDGKRLLEQMEEIDRLNEKLSGITLLKGIEVDILEDGSLDLPDDILGRLDLVVGAVHSHFQLSRARQTERILRAMDHPHFSILAHPSGRLIPQRPPYEVDMERIIHHAAGRGCYLELNAHPERLDLQDSFCMLARERGVLIAVNTDAHSVLDFANLKYGVGQARRGWLAATDVLNTRPLKELRPLLKCTMG